jgi:glycosyltransferase involved in cell wall biosynthesis
LNILWISHLIPYPPKGGVLQRSYNLIKEVAKHHNVHLLAFNQRALLSPGRDMDEAVAALGKICKSVKVLSIPTEGEKYGRYLSYLKSMFTPQAFTISWLQSTEMEKLIEGRLKAFKIDVVHFDTISLAPFSYSIGGCKKVLNHHNIESTMMIRRARKEPNIFNKAYMYLEGYKIRSYETQVCKSFDVNITCSRQESERLLNQTPQLKIEEIPNGVDLDYFYPLNLKKMDHSLIFAGGMNWYPNRDAMLFFTDKVWPLLKKEIPDIKMTVIGQDPPQKLKNLARNDKNFIVTGFVDDVRPYIDQATVYVCPIKDGGGTKLKILDALAMGKAIVADPVSCEGIDVVDGESVLFTEIPDDYVKSIKRLFDDGALLQKLGNNGRNLILEKYSFINIGRKLSRLYETI